jgi:hypothetical protein
VSPMALLQGVIARIISAQEAIEDGDSSYAHTLLLQLEGDLVGSLAALSMEEAE